MSAFAESSHETVKIKDSTLSHYPTPFCKRTIASPMDMFLQAGVLWNITMGEKPNPEFEVKIVTADGQPITALNNIPLIPACSMHDISEVDLIIIPSQGFFYDVESNVHQERADWLVEWYGKGADLAAVCAGAFTLASTGCWMVELRQPTGVWQINSESSSRTST